MRNRNPSMVEIIWSLDKTNFKFKCKVCGQIWWRYPGSERLGWQCPKGCKLKE